MKVKSIKIQMIEKIKSFFIKNKRLKIDKTIIPQEQLDVIQKVK